MCVISESLPTPPSGHHYYVERVSKLLAKVWLVRDEWSPILAKDIRSIYCFVKGSKNLRVHKPMSSKKSYARSLCSLDELSQMSPFSLMNPPERLSLLHLQ